MALEDRKGRFYYYCKERIGGQVYSRYMGSGDTAELLAAMENTEQEQAAEERAKRRRERQKNDEAAREIRELADATDTLLTVFYLSQGYHNHKGEWRYARRK